MRPSIRLVYGSSVLGADSVIKRLSGELLGPVCSRRLQPPAVSISMYTVQICGNFLRFLTPDDIDH